MKTKKFHTKSPLSHFFQHKGQMFQAILKLYILAIKRNMFIRIKMLSFILIKLIDNKSKKKIVEFNSIKKIEYSITLEKKLNILKLKK